MQHPEDETVTNICAEPGCDAEVHYGGLTIGRNGEGVLSDPPWYWVHYNTEFGSQIIIPSFTLPDGYIIGDLETDGRARCIQNYELADALGI